MRIGFWIGIQLVVVAIASLPFWVSFTMPRESILLDHARLVSVEPEEIRLPDDWHSRNEKGPAVTYELTLEIERVPEQPWALLLTRPIS